VFGLEPQLLRREAHDCLGVFQQVRLGGFARPGQAVARVLHGQDVVLLSGGYVEALVVDLAHRGHAVEVFRVRVQVDQQHLAAGVGQAVRAAPPRQRHRPEVEARHVVAGLAVRSRQGLSLPDRRLGRARERQASAQLLRPLGLQRRGGGHLAETGFRRVCSGRFDAAVEVAGGRPVDGAVESHALHLLLLGRQFRLRCGEV